MKFNYIDHVTMNYTRCTGRRTTLSLILWIVGKVIYYELDNRNS